MLEESHCWGEDRAQGRLELGAGLGRRDVRARNWELDHTGLQHKEHLPEREREVCHELEMKAGLKLWRVERVLSRRNVVGKVPVLRTMI